MPKTTPSDPNNPFTEDVIKRFVKRLKIGEKPINCDDECIEWVGGLDDSGYGRLTVGSRENNKTIKAHRWALGFSLGGINLPSEILVCHHCDNPACVRPTHLFAGTSQDNINDMWNKGRHPIVNAKLSIEQILYIRSSSAPGKQLSEELNVCEGTISLARNNITWKDIA